MKPAGGTGGGTPLALGCRLGGQVYGTVCLSTVGFFSVRCVDDC